MLAVLLLTALPAASDPFGYDNVVFDPFGFRFAKGRAKAVARYGGDQATEAAVAKALKWLQAVQKPDGSWGGTHPAALTGLALLAFLGHGETPDSPRFGETVRKGLAWLHGAAARNHGYFEECGVKGYCHAIGTFAVCEAYALTLDPRLKGTAQTAVGLIVAGQSGTGGFNYTYSPNGRDLSVGGWNLQALNAARVALPGQPGVATAVRRACADLKANRDVKTGMFFYQLAGPGSESLTAAGVLCLCESGEGGSPEARQALGWLKANAKLDWDAPGSWPLYKWYYQTLAFFRAEVNWREWNASLKKQLLPHQSPEGFWTTPANSSGLSGEDLQVYSTTLCALMLEVYYRHYNGSAGKAAKEGGKTGKFQNYLKAKLPSTQNFKGISF